MKNFRCSALLAPVLLSMAMALGACGGWEGVEGAEQAGIEEPGRAPRPGEGLHECRFLKALDSDHDAFFCRSDDGEPLVIRAPAGALPESLE